MGDSAFCGYLRTYTPEEKYGAHELLTRTSFSVPSITISFSVQEGIEDLLWGPRPCRAVDHVLPLSCVGPVVPRRSCDP